MTTGTAALVSLSHRQHAVLATALVCASWVAAGSAVGTQYYVSSSGGSDDNAGTSPSAAWATITKLTDFGWDPGFRPGDTIFLDGTFTDYLWIQVRGVTASATGSSSSPASASVYLSSS